jgi:LacI family transcriptional regulator
VAFRAGVSITTVSHIINNTRFVSEELRVRVLDAMADLNYKPNSLARSLRIGKTKTIGLVVPDNSNPFFAEVSRCVENIGFEQSYSVILCNSDGLLEKEAAYINSLIAKQVDGVIFIATGNTEEPLRDLIRNNIPFIVVDRELQDISADVVLVNNEQGGYIATKYLLDLNHKKIACILGPSELTPSADRVEGYQRALTEAGILIKNDYLVPGDFRSKSGEFAMSRLLELPSPPTAVFACNDMMAIGALRFLHSRNIRIPEQISIIGFDNIPLAEEMSPALTTIAQPIAKIASTAAERLVSIIQNKASHPGTKRFMLETFLVVRDSCGFNQLKIINPNILDNQNGKS